MYIKRGPPSSTGSRIRGGLFWQNAFMFKLGQCAPVGREIRAPACVERYVGTCP